MKKAISMFIALMVLTVMSLSALAIDSVSLRGSDANAYIKYGAFQSQGYVKTGDLSYTWDTKGFSNVISNENGLIEFQASGYVQQGRVRTIATISVAYDSVTGTLAVAALDKPLVVKSVVQI